MVIYSLVTLAGSLVLILLGYRVLSEEHRRRVNVVFALFCFAGSYVSLVEFLTWLAETEARAQAYARVAVLWPLAPALFLHFCLLLRRDRLPRLVVISVYSAAAVTGAVYYRFVATGNAVAAAASFYLRSPFVTEWPHWMSTLLATAFHITSLVVLITASVRRSRASTQVRWVLAGYGIGLFVGIGAPVADQILYLGIPEFNGVTYAAFAVVMFVAIAQRNVIVLTPRSTAEHIVDAMQELLFLTDDSGRVLTVNRAAATAFGDRRLLGGTLQATVGGPGDTGRTDVWIPEGDVSTTIDGDDRCLNFTVSEVRARSGDLVGRVFIARDVTGDRRRERNLAMSLREKEELLREVHHRVNNSLQLVISLIDLKSAAIRDAAASNGIAELLRRIRLVAHTYEMVYAEEDVASISVAALVETVVCDTLQGHPNRNRVTPHFDFASVTVGLRLAIPLALALAELVSNVVVHAFPEAHRGNAWFTVTDEREGRFSVTVRDDGVGLRTEQADRQLSGLRIASALCEQASLDLTIASEGGTLCTISGRFTPGSADGRRE